MVDSVRKFLSGVKVAMILIQIGIGDSHAILNWTINRKAIEKYTYEPIFPFQTSEIERLDMVMINPRILRVAIKLVETVDLICQWLFVRTRVLIE